MTTLDDIPFNIDYYLDRIREEYNSLERAVLGYEYKKPTAPKVTPPEDNQITPFEAVANVAETVLRFRGKWRGAATLSTDVDGAVSYARHALWPISVNIVADVRTELIRRANAAPTEINEYPTPFDAAITLAKMLLCMKGQWRGAATSPVDIDRAAAAACFVMGIATDQPDFDMRADVSDELLRRANATNP
jgi:hypothetical protein